MASLNKNDFRILNNSAYIKVQVALIDEKLDLMGRTKKKQIKFNLNNFAPMSLATDDTGGVMYGRLELESIRERLMNRLKIQDVGDLVEKYPHTTSALIAKVISENSHLRVAKATDFVPDMPKDAIKAMQEYKDKCIKLCNKTPIFYVIAKHEDFQKKNARRDPILLAQSPFGFFWQILGAWDDEMIYLGDL